MRTDSVLTSEFSYEPVQIPHLIQAGKFEKLKLTSDGKLFLDTPDFFPLSEWGGFFITVFQRSRKMPSQEPKAGERFKHPYLKEIWIVIRWELDRKWI